MLRPLLRELGFDPLVKTSGSLGLHVHAPLDRPLETKSLARDRRALAVERPAEVTAEMRRSGRAGRVYVDWLRTTGAVRRSRVLRARRARAHRGDPAGVGELEDDPDSLVFTPADALARVERDGDLFEPLTRPALDASQP